MKKQLLSTILAGTVVMSLLTGCGASKSTYDAKTVLGYNDYKITDYVKLGDLSQIDLSNIEKPEDISDESLKSYLDSQLQSYPSYTESSHETVQDGDTVNIDYVGTIDGKEFNGGSANDCYLKIGSDTYIEGFEDGLLNHKKGNKVTLNLTFPKDYDNPEYAGKAVAFQVTINGIYDAKYQTSETVTDEYISQTFGYETIDAYLEYLKEYLETSSEYNYEYSIQNAVVDQLLESSEITIPDGLVDSKLDSYQTYYNDFAKEEEKTLDEYTKENLGYDTFDDYRKDAKLQVESQTKEDLLFQAIALELKSSFTEKEFNDFVEKQMEQNNFSEEDLYEQYGGSREKTMVVFLESVALDDLAHQLEEEKGINEGKNETEDAGK